MVNLGHDVLVSVMQASDGEHLSIPTFLGDSQACPNAEPLPSGAPCSVTTIDPASRKPSSVVVGAWRCRRSPGIYGESARW